MSFCYCRRHHYGLLADLAFNFLSDTNSTAVVGQLFAC